MARHKIEPTGMAVKLIVTPDPIYWKADGQDLMHLYIQAVDAKGRLVSITQDELSFSVDGDARIVAVSNGDINSEEVNCTDHRRLWNGSALVILRAGQTPSKVTLKTKSDHFKTVITKLETK